MLKPYLHKGVEEFSGEAGKSYGQPLKKRSFSDDHKAVIANAETALTEGRNQESLIQLVKMQLENSDDYTNSLHRVSQELNGDTNVQINQYGWERIVCVVNTDYCSPEDLLFDIRNNRISTYSIQKTGEKAATKDLSGTFSLAIKGILDDFECILKMHGKDNYQDHERHFTPSLMLYVHRRIS
jgi:hypothetical protein